MWPYILPHSYQLLSIKENPTTLNKNYNGNKIGLTYTRTQGHNTYIPNEYYADVEVLLTEC